MTEIVLTKAATGALVPVDQQGIDYLSKLKLGAGVTVTIKRHRNPGHHRKFFALLNLGFDSWEPEGAEYKGQQVAKNFDQFRNDVTVLAGYHETTLTLKNEVRVVAKSISFGKMDQDEFQKLYNAVANVLLERVLLRYKRADLDNVINQILGFV